MGKDRQATCSSLRVQLFYVVINHENVWVRIVKQLLSSSSIIVMSTNHEILWVKIVKQRSLTTKVCGVKN